MDIVKNGYAYNHQFLGRNGTNARENSIAQRAQMPEKINYVVVCLPVSTSSIVMES